MTDVEVIPPGAAARAKRPKAPGSGRKKGTQDKSTRLVKQALHEAFEELGGVAALVRFGKTHPAEFYRLWARMAPLQVNFDANVKHDVVATIQEGRARVAADRARR